MRLYVGDVEAAAGNRIAPIVCLVNKKTFLCISCSEVGSLVKGKVDEGKEMIRKN